MDGSAKEIVVDENGRCNFCHTAQREIKLAQKERTNLNKIIERIKKDGKKYDVLIGLSGGVDSSYALHNAVRLGLRPLCFFVDNSWNTPTSDENVMRLVEGLKVPFYRYVIDKKKFTELQGAFLRAGLINAEIPTDHVLMAASYDVARQYGIKWIISGGNVATESIMPASWSYPARDLVHIKDVYEKTTGKKLNGLPLCGIWRYNFYKWIKGIKTLYLLDYSDYNRAVAISILEDKYGWIDYGDKHCESIFTKWFQNFYLFEKFGIDKRKAHLSSEINSGQITKEEAIAQWEKRPEYPEIGLEAKVMKYPKREHSEFATDEALWNRMCKVVRFLRKLGFCKLDYLGS